MPKGEKRAGGRPRKEKDEHRRQVNTSIDPDTMRMLEWEQSRTGLSIGKIIDAWGEVYRNHPKERLLNAGVTRLSADQYQALPVPKQQGKVFYLALGRGDQLVLADSRKEALAIIKSKCGAAATVANIRTAIGFEKGKYWVAQCQKAGLRAEEQTLAGAFYELYPEILRFTDDPKPDGFIFRVQDTGDTEQLISNLGELLKSEN